MPARKPLKPKPEPVIKSQVCSICGLDWEQHGKTPSIEKCVELLTAEIAQLRSPGANAQTWGIVSTPWPITT